MNVLCTLDRILELVKKNNINQKDLTDYLGISKNSFTNWKGGLSRSYRQYLPQIAEFFNVSLDYLAGKETSAVENDFTYALYDELAHDLSEEQIQQLKQFADFLRNSKK